MFYALIENGEITRINISLPVNIGNTSIPDGATGLEQFGLYPIIGDGPSFNPERERIAGPQYQFDGTHVNRVYTVEQIPDEEKAAQVRALRNQKLAATDWVITKALETGTPVPDYILNERQSLRNITTQAGFPWDVEWPTDPTA